MKLLKLASVMSLAVVIGLLAQQAASATSVEPSNLRPDCLTHALTVTVNAQIELDSYIDNACNSSGAITITYVDVAPCPHRLSVALNLPTGPFDIVSFLNTRCAGHHILRQRITSNGHALGQDSAEFDIPA